MTSLLTTFGFQFQNETKSQIQTTTTTTKRIQLIFCSTSESFNLSPTKNLIMKIIFSHAPMWILIISFKHSFIDQSFLLMYINSSSLQKERKISMCNFLYFCKNPKLIFLLTKIKKESKQKCELRFFKRIKVFY